MTSDGCPVAATHRHKQRATEYVLIGIGKMQAEHWRDPNLDAEYDNQAVDMREVAIYRSVDDGSLWVRPREEFEDGRFEALPVAAPVASGGDEEPEAFVKFLKLAARHFDNLPTGGEDMAHWANISNAECCRKIAYSITADKAEIALLRGEFQKMTAAWRVSCIAAEASESRCAALMAYREAAEDHLERDSQLSLNILNRARAALEAP